MLAIFAQLSILRTIKTILVNPAPVFSYVSIR